MIWIVVIGLLILLLIWWGKQPNYYRNKKPSDFKSFIEGLINQGVDGSLLFIKHQRSKRFVQFAKYVTNSSESIINFGFPDAKWSRNIFKPLAEAFDKAGIDYSIRGTGDDAEFVSRFIDINKKIENIEITAEEFSHIAKIAFNVMGIGEEEKFRIHFEGGLKITDIYED